MNPLSRRVSSVKTNEDGKNISKPLALPEGYQEIEDEVDYVKKFSFAETVQDQLHFIEEKLRAKEISNDELKFFADVMFQSPFKHAVRNKIMKLFQRHKHPELVVDALSISIAALIANLKTLSLEKSNDILTSLRTCFENFRCGTKALGRHLDELFSGLNVIIEKLITEASVQHAPSVKNVFCIFLHNTIRLTLSCIQEYNKTQSFDSLHEDIRRLKSNCVEIINTNDIPMDIKTNCGMLLAHTARILQEVAYVQCCMELAANENKCFDLCLCMGFLNIIDLDFFVVNSQIVAKIIENIIEICTVHSNENTMLLAGLRCLVQFSRFLIDKVFVDQEILKNILRKMIEFDLSFIGCNMDNVRHLCKDMLRNIFKFKDKSMLDDLIREIFVYCHSADIPTAFRSVVITCVGSVLGAEFVLRKFPTLFLDIFSGLEKDSNVCTCYETLMLCHLKENACDIKIWRATWIDPLLNYASIFPDKIEVVEKLLNKAVVHDPQIADLIISNIVYEIPMCVKFSIMWTLRKKGLKYDRFEQVFLGMRNDLMLASRLNSDEVKIMALRLIVESNKTTTYATYMECDFILQFLRYNSNCQSPATREKMLALILKFLSRLELNVTRCKKEKRHYLLHTYSLFLLTFLDLLASNFFVGANFSRKSISLNLLERAVNIVISNDLARSVPKQLRKCLFDLLNDSYESNAAIAINILKSMSRTGTKECEIRVSLETIHNLITSVRPADCVTAAYYLEYFCLELSVHDVQRIFLVENLPQQHPVYFSIIIWLLRILNVSLDTAEKSITLAAKISPLYGSLFVIRHFLAKLDFVELSNCSKWRQVVGTLITNCKRMAKVVGPIVNSSSPEGHLPNDFSELSNYLDENTGESDAKFEQFLKKKLSFCDNKDFKVTPQMILLCAWRTIKEVSLTLGEIILRSPVQKFKDDEKYFVTAQQILDVGDLFIELLSETKHRGAFEQAYVGFSKLCTRLWRVPHAALNELPSKWLMELIDLITTDKQINKKICATRRSAGVPFMVQAICVTELHVGGTTSLQSCMSKFINIASDLKKSEESRTHALNIMRALFRCTELNAVIGEYIADAVKCAVNGYASKSWSENNSSTLLLSALIVRIFGVQRSKGADSVSKENKMTGRIFFLRYPSLYDFMITELRYIVQSVALNSERSDKLRPILMILSRLYPSALDGTETMYKLCTFVPLVSACCECQDWQDRVMIAKTIVAFTPIKEMDSMIMENFERTRRIFSLSPLLDVNTNHLQSLLLQSLYLLRAKQIDYKFAQDLVSRTYSILIISQLNPHIFAIIIDILLSVMEKCSSIHKYDEVTKVQLFLIPKLDNINYKILKRSMFIYNMRLLIGYNYVSNLVLYVNGILRTAYDINLDHQAVESCLNVLLMLFRHQHPLKEIVEQFECSIAEIALVESLSLDMKHQIIDEMSQNEDFKNILLSLTQFEFFCPHVTVRAYSVLSKLNSTRIGDHHFIATILDNEDHYNTDEIKDSVTQCIGKILHDGTANQANFCQILDFISNVCQPWNLCALRKSAAYVLREVAQILFSSSKNVVSQQILFVFAKLVLSMIQDDDSEVREIISMTITDLFSTSPTQEALVESYSQIVFFEKFADYMELHFDVDSNLQIIKNLIEFLRPDNNDNQKTDYDDGTEVFDKQEVNVFGEPYRIILDMLNVFFDKFSADSSMTYALKSVAIDLFGNNFRF